jgi:aldose 1-epimerase
MQKIMQINSYLFDKLEENNIICYQLINDNGFQVDILNYGGIIHQILLPDHKSGKLVNVVLNFPDLAGYLESNLYLGCITGRHAGRIGNAEFTLNGITYHLAKNSGEHNLHGGISGLDKKFWDVNELADGIQLTYTSPDMEEGFPALVEFIVNYRIIGDYSLQIEYYALPNADTIINLSNHTYFNLSGRAHDATRQLLSINADKYCQINSSGLVTGTIADVADTPFDFRQPKLIIEDIKFDDQQLYLAKGYDHPFMLIPDSKSNDTNDKRQSVHMVNEEHKHAGEFNLGFGINSNNHPDAILIEPLSRRSLEVYTQEKFIVLYSGNYLTIPRSGICLETQNIPNAINLDWSLDKSIYSPSKPYNSLTTWKFLIP